MSPEEIVDEGEALVAVKRGAAMAGTVDNPHLTILIGRGECNGTKTVRTIAGMME